MAFKFVVLATLLAYANAGGLIAAPVATYSAAPAVSSSYIHQASPVGLAHAAPVVSAYAASPVAIHAPAYGQTYQSLERSLGGGQSVSHYSKAVDSAFSSVRKYDTRVTNDALSVAHAPVVSAYSAPVYNTAYSAGPSVSTSYIQKTAPYATYAQAAPVATYAHAAPVATYANAVNYAHAAPVATYANAVNYAHAAPVATYAHAAPVATYAHAAPVATYAHAAPVATYAHAAPVATYSAGPVVAKAALSYSPATVVSHTSFSGLGAAYQW